MKKSFLTALMVCCICLIAHAYTMYGGFSFKENGETVARIELSANGRVEMADYETGSSWSGTYEIDGQPAPGDTRSITFYINGQTYYGTYLWPRSGKQAISFDGLYFEMSRR